MLYPSLYSGVLYPFSKKSAHWPTQPAKVSSSDIVKVLQKFHKASSLDVAKTIVDHFEVTKGQAASIRRRNAGMVSMKQSTLTIPFVVCFRWWLMRGAVAALRRIDDFLSTYESRDCCDLFD